jgi:hypothetical protein
VRTVVRIHPASFDNLRRCIEKKKKHFPHYEELSSKACRSCGKGIKQKHLQQAKACGHKPPDLCYLCMCETKNKKTPRERKIELSKRKAREREKNNPSKA